MNKEEEFLLLLYVYNCFVNERIENEHLQLLDDDDGVEEKEEEEGGWDNGGQWWWWTVVDEEKEEIDVDCCFVVNSTGIGSAKASFTFGNWLWIL